MKPSRYLILFLIILLGMAWVPPSQIWAQGSWDNEDLWEDDGFDDDFEGDGFEDFESEDFSEEDFFKEDEEAEGDYLDEDVFPEGAEKDFELTLLRQQQLLLEERINAPFNVAYGGGTGLLLGGWFALLFATTSRDTLRAIGVGIVLGGVIGAVLGTRSVWDPNAPRPPNLIPEPEAPTAFNPPESVPSLTLTWNF